MNIEELYENEQFNNLLEMIAAKNKIRSFDDFRQDVFLEIIDSNCTSMKQYKRAAQKIGIRYYRDMHFVDINSLAYENENGEIETDDEVMARLVYSGRGRYV